MPAQLFAGTLQWFVVEDATLGDVRVYGRQFGIEFLAQDGQPVAVARLLLVRSDVQACRFSLLRPLQA